MMKAGLLPELTSEIYEAALQPQRWGRTLDRVAEVMDCAGVIMLPEQGLDIPPCNPGRIDGVVDAYVGEKWFLDNLRLRRTAAFRGAKGETGPDRRPPHASQQIMREVFGLTEAESRLAERLMQGETVAQTAAAIGIALLTARSQLYAVFLKTGVSRQSELLELLGRTR